MNFPLYAVSHYSLQPLFLPFCCTPAELPGHNDRIWQSSVRISEGCALAIREAKALPLRDIDTGSVAAGDVGALVIQEGALVDSHFRPSRRNGGKSLPCNRCAELSVSITPILY